MSTTADHLDAVEAQGHSFALSAQGAFRRPVASCEPWTVADLVWHLGEVHYFWNEIVRTGAASPTSVPRITRPDDNELMEWYVGNLRALMSTLRGADPSASCWSWAGMVDIAWVIRRMAHETAVHAWDAASAGGGMSHIEPALASDGIDEFLEWFLPNHRETALPIGGSVHIHCTDTHGEWLIMPDDAMGLHMTREHAKGSCALRGTASDVFLMLWRRLPITRAELIGDSSVATKFVERTNLE